MHRIFLFGTLRHVPLLRSVAGTDVSPREAWLEGQSARQVEGADFPVLRRQRAVRAEGLLVEVDDDALARLDYYEVPFGYARQPVQVMIESGPVAAEVYLAQEGRWSVSGPWSFEAWVARFGDVATRAAPEIMAGRNYVPAERAALAADTAWSRAQAELHAGACHRPRSIGSRKSAENFQLISRNIEHLDFFALETQRFRHDSQHDAAPLEVARTVFRAGEAVTVLPYAPMRDRVLLIEQFRVGAAAQNDPDPWLLEPIAGIVDPGESVEEAGHRETREEAGILLKSLHFIARYYPSPGGVAQVLHSYIGLADLPDGLSLSGGLASEGEDIALHLVDYAQFATLLETGELANAPIILSAQYLAQNRAGYRALFSGS